MSTLQNMRQPNFACLIETMRALLSNMSKSRDLMENRSQCNLRWSTLVLPDPAQAMRMVHPKRARLPISPEPDDRTPLWRKLTHPDPPITTSLYIEDLRQ